MAHETLIRTDLVPAWNASQERYMAFFCLVLGVADGLRALLDEYPAAFSVDEAAGAQLDMLGKWLQVSRVLPFAPVSGSRILGDEDYRLLIRAQIARNTWDGTNEGAETIFSTVFPSFGIVLEDRQDASINVVIRGSFTDLQIEMINAGLLIPHPAGILMTYEIPQTISTSTITVRSGVYLAGQIAIHSTQGGTET